MVGCPTYNRSIFGATLQNNPGKKELKPEIQDVGINISVIDVLE